MVEAATAIFGSYAGFLRAASNIDQEVVDAVTAAARAVRDHWLAERSRLPGDDGLAP